MVQHNFSGLRKRRGTRQTGELGTLQWPSVAKPGHCNAQCILPLEFPHRFDALIATAIAELPSFEKAEVESDEHADDDDEAYGAVDPPTSPPAADQY